MNTHVSNYRRVTHGGAGARHRCSGLTHWVDIPPVIDTKRNMLRVEHVDVFPAIRCRKAHTHPVQCIQLGKRRDEVLFVLDHILIINQQQVQMDHVEPHRPHIQSCRPAASIRCSWDPYRSVACWCTLQLCDTHMSVVSYH